MPKENYAVSIGVKCHRPYKTALDRIAQANNLEKGASLLRIAGQAIIDHAALYGDTAVPIDMAITQAPKHVDQFQAAEAPLPAGPPRTAAQLLGDKKFVEAELKKGHGKP
jgi:hypothetical protein